MRFNTPYGLLILVLILVSCGTEVGPPEMSTISIEGHPVRTLLPGETVQLEVNLIDEDGNIISADPEVMWSSENDERVSVSAGGQIQAGEALGNTWIYAGFDGLAEDGRPGDIEFRDSVAVWVQKSKEEPSAFDIKLYWGDHVPESFRKALEIVAVRWEEVIRDRLPAVQIEAMLEKDACTYQSQELPDSLTTGIEEGVRIYVYMSDAFPEGTYVEAVGGPCIQRDLPFPTTVLGKITGNVDRFVEGIEPERLEYVMHHEMGHALGLVGIVQRFQPYWIEHDGPRDVYRGHLGLYGYYLRSGNMEDYLYTNGHWPNKVSDIMGGSSWDRINEVSVGGLMDLGYPAAWYGAGRTAEIDFEGRY